jgi:hypothetical protein
MTCVFVSNDKNATHCALADGYKAGQILKKESKNKKKFHRVG